jgi:intein/homing endonuclease
LKRKYDGDTIKIKARYLEPIECTPDHPILVVRKEYYRFECNQFKKPHQRSELKVQWINAKDIRKYDYLVMPRLKPEYTTKTLDLLQYNNTDSRFYRRGLKGLELTDDIAWMFGLYVAEGSIGRLKPGNLYLTFHLHQKETEYADRLRNIFGKLGYRVTSYKSKDSLGIVHNVYCTALAKVFPDWFGSNALVKHIPDFIMHAPDSIKRSFLRGLFSGDGYIHGNQINLHTSSKTLASQTQLLLASLGVMVGLSLTPGGTHVIRGRPLITGWSWQLRGRSYGLSEIFQYEYTFNKLKPKGIKNYQVFDNYILIPIMDVKIFR